MGKTAIEKAGEIIAARTMLSKEDNNDKYCVLILRDLDGYPYGSTKSAAKSDGIKWIAFGTGVDTNDAKRARECSLASVCFNKGGSNQDMYNITLTGRIEIVTDPDIKKETWYGNYEYFTGPDDPKLCVLMFRTERYNLWNVNGDGKWESGRL